MSRYASLFTGRPADEPRGEYSSTLKPEAPPRYQILLVDDEPNVLKALQRVFRQENYQIITARSGAEAAGPLRLITYSEPKSVPPEELVSEMQIPIAD